MKGGKVEIHIQWAQGDVKKSRKRGGDKRSESGVTLQESFTVKLS